MIPHQPKQRVVNNAIVKRLLIIAICFFSYHHSQSQKLYNGFPIEQYSDLNQIIVVPNRYETVDESKMISETSFYFTDSMVVLNNSERTILIINEINPIQNKIVIDTKDSQYDEWYEFDIHLNDKKQITKVEVFSRSIYRGNYFVDYYLIYDETYELLKRLLTSQTLCENIMNYEGDEEMKKILIAGTLNQINYAYKFYLEQMEGINLTARKNITMIFEHYEKITSSRGQRTPSNQNGLILCDEIIRSMTEIYYSN